MTMTGTERYNQPTAIISELLMVVHVIKIELTVFPAERMQTRIRNVMSLVTVQSSL